MKNRLYILVLLISFQSFSQISLGPEHLGKSRKFKQDELKRFKNTETIFLLSRIYDKEVYENILKDSWDVTPFRVLDLEGFDIENYTSDKYSIAQLGGFKRIKQMKYGGESTSLFTYIDFKIYDSEQIAKKLSKLTGKKKKEKMSDIISDNSIDVARFYIFPKDDFIVTALSKNMNEIVYSLYSEDVFFNYKPGFLKNYFQKISQLINKEDTYWMYGKDYLPELKKLTKNKLYIPSYVTIKYNGLSMKDSEENEENIEKIFKDYEYQYEIIPDDELNQKIMNNEEFYYLRYVRMNAERFLQVINSKTGEIIYRDYITGLSYKLKSKNIKELNSKIKKAS